MNINTHLLHRVETAAGLNAVSSRYVGPLLGNGELCLFLDENGVMHDYAPLPGRGAPRIYWAGRRLRPERRPMVSFGYFTALPSWEWLESKHWTQSLDPRSGIIRTVHERASGREETETMLLLDRNLIAVHKQIERLRGSASLDFRFRLCPPGALGLPEGVSIRGAGTDETGAWLEYELCGVVRHLGRIALWADKPCTAEVRDNELRLTIPLKAAADEVTLYLAFADDLGDEMFYKHAGWLGRYADHPMLAPVIRDLHGRPVTKSDPVQIVHELRNWTRKDGWAAVRQQQTKCWGEFFQPGWLDLPDARDVQAIWETGMYATRTQLTRWSIPVTIHGDIFNGMYFWDAMAGAKTLLQAGHWPLVQRMAEHYLSVLPLGMQMVDGVGARLEQANCEGGYFHLVPQGCQIYEVHAGGYTSRLVWAWSLYAGMNRQLLERYYPIFWGAAEFFRRWMVYQGPDGKYFTGTCVDVNELEPAVRNGTHTVASAAGSMTLAANVAERLGRDPELVAEWRKLAAGLVWDARTNKRGLLAAYDGDEGVSAAAFCSSVASVFTPGWIRADDPRLRRTLEVWLKECKSAENWAVDNCPGSASGSDVKNPDHCVFSWVAGWALHVAALIRDGEIASQITTELIRCAGNFGSLYEGKVIADGFTSLPWFVTSSAEMSAGIMMMLVQDDGEQIELLPAIPSAWKNFAFQLAVTNRTIVRVEVKDGALRKLELTGPPEPRKVRIPARFEPGALLAKATCEDQFGQTFVLNPKPSRP